VRYIDGFRDQRAAAALSRRLQALGPRLAGRERPAALMEVCGTHTMSIGRFGLRDLLPPNVRLLSGPGCPVCVTPSGYVDAAVRLARDGAIVATFGDMLRVPGSEGTSLAAVRAEGGRVEICYSPEAALRLAREEPGREVVFLAIGFETTVAPVVSLVPAARKAGVENLSLLTAFRRILPALAALLDDPDVAVDGFLCPAHVSAIIGAEAYRTVVERWAVPCVVAGFEPLDILLGIEALLDQLADGRAELANQYSRVVRPQGNPRALALMDELLEPADAEWRGLGTLPASGLRLREAHAAYDAERKLELTIPTGRDDPRCRCGDVLRGIANPPECGLFGRTCTPTSPIGACMVSSEGTCAAWFRYARTS
jgi:hydrogenase expression/formation protein HypD